MKEERFYLSIDEYEQGVLLRVLNDKKSDLIKQGKATDAVDELIVKVGKAPTKKFKVLERDTANAR